MILWQRIKCFFGFHNWVHGGIGYGDETIGTTGAAWCIKCKKMKTPIDPELLELAKGIEQQEYKDDPVWAAAMAEEHKYIKD